MIKRILSLFARLIILCRPEPDSAIIIGIVKVMRAPGAGRLRALVPAFSAVILSSTDTDLASSGEAYVPTLSDQGALAVAALAVIAKDPDREVAALESHVTRHSQKVAPQIFERLADTYLSRGDIEQATETLQTGVDIYPESGKMHLALAKLRSDNSEWPVTAWHWQRVPQELQDAADIWTVIGVARAYRHIGKPSTAYEHAKRAAVSHTGSELLQDEIRLCRPFVIDWPNSLVIANPTERAGHAGAVTSTGFLHGGGKSLKGWVKAAEKDTPKVQLLVNDRVVATTRAAGETATPPEKKFAINCKALQQYLGDGDTIRVVCNDNAIVLPGLGSAAMVSCGEASQFDQLQKRLDDGYVFTKDGRLRPGHNADSKRAVLDLFEEILGVIETDTGQPVFPFYGNLLGAIRENDFIFYDVDGFDVLYLCKSSEPDEVRNEVVRVGRLLAGKGYDLRVERFSLMIRRNHPDEIFVDLNYGWFTPADELNASFGWRHAPVQGQEEFVADRQCRLADRDVRVPGNAEEVLLQLYGPGWRVPDQGFASRKHLQRDDRFLLTEREKQAITSSA